MRNPGIPVIGRETRTLGCTWAITSTGTTGGMQPWESSAERKPISQGGSASPEDVNRLTASGRYYIHDPWWLNGT